MSDAGPSPSADGRGPAGSLRAFFQWLFAGIAGVGIFFALAAHFSISDRSPGVFGIILGIAAGWGLGRGAAVMQLGPTAAIAVATWFCIVSGEVLAAAKTNHDRVARLKTQAAGDPLTEGGRRFLSEEPPGESAENREQRLELLRELERGEALRQQRLTFDGYLTSRIPREWGRWKPPWPAAFWSAEVLIAGTLGTWTAMSTVRAFSSQTSHANEIRSDDPPQPVT